MTRLEHATAAVEGAIGEYSRSEAGATRIAPDRESAALRLATAAILIVFQARGDSAPADPDLLRAFQIVHATAAERDYQAGLTPRPPV